MKLISERSSEPGSTFLMKAPTYFPRTAAIGLRKVLGHGNLVTKVLCSLPEENVLVPLGLRL